MRICMVTHSLYESDCRVMRYAESLAARGDEVDVIALKKEGKPAEETIAGVRVFRIQEAEFPGKTQGLFPEGCVHILPEGGVDGYEATPSKSLRSVSHPFHSGFHGVRRAPAEAAGSESDPRHS